MRLIYLTCAIGALLALDARAQGPAAPVPTGYVVFAGGVPLGREDIRVQADGSGTTVTSQGRLSTQLSVLIRRAEFKYRPDWTPESVSFDGDLAGADVSIKSVFKDGVAVTEGTQANKPVAVTHKVSPQAVMLINPVFAGYAALARRLAAAPPTA